MILRKTICLSGLMLCLMSSVALALGLGEITSYSTINEPFHAEVQLTDLGDLNEREIVIGFASIQHFEEKQLDYHHFLQGFEFKLLLQDQQNPRVKITSRSAIKEPFLGFVLEARWPEGRMQREYTLLLDKPISN